MYYRLIKPKWAIPTLGNNKPNPQFVREIPGYSPIEGYQFSHEFLQKKNEEGYGIYYMPNHPSSPDVYDSTKFVSHKHIDVFKFLFVDMDLKDGVYKTKEEFLDTLNAFECKPTMVVDSGNGIHAYWRVTDLGRDSYVFMQMALLTHFKTDDSIYTAFQLLRLPGYKNTKDPNNYKNADVLLDFSSDNEYKLSDFPEHILNLSPESINKVQDHIDLLDGKKQVIINESVDVSKLPEKFVELLNTNKLYNDLFYSPQGDRSSVDLGLANRLRGLKYTKEEVLAILANTEKALEQGKQRMYYAQRTVDKAFEDVKPPQAPKETTPVSRNNFLTVGERLEQGHKLNLGEPINGPTFFDTGVLFNSWRKSQIMGLIAGSGVGKTSIALKIIKEIIENNPTCNDVYLFITIEMPEQEIIERWISLVGRESPLAHRLYVIGDTDDRGEQRLIGLQEIHEYCLEIQKATGNKVGSIIIDHFGIISKHIDIRKKHNFGIVAERDTGFGDIKTLSANTLATKLKVLTKMLNTFTIVLTQTTKEKGKGDTPIDKDGAYGISDYENIMDFIITAWQPLMRVQDRSPYHFLAWQYVKIRHKHKNDRIRTHQQKVLTYEIESGDLRPCLDEEYQVFTELLPEAEKVREQLVKKVTREYSKTVNLQDLRKVTEALRIVKA